MRNGRRSDGEYYPDRLSTYVGEVEGRNRFRQQRFPMSIEILETIVWTLCHDCHTPRPLATVASCQPKRQRHHAMPQGRSNHVILFSDGRTPLQSAGRAR